MLTSHDRVIVVPGPTFIFMQLQHKFRTGFCRLTMPQFHISMSLAHYIIFFLFLITGPLLLQSCTELSDYDQDRVKDAISDSLLSTTESRNIQMDLIEDGFRRVRVVSPFAATYTRDGRSETELRESVSVTVRDSTGAIETTVESQSARYLGHQSEFHFKNNVVVETDRGRRLFTDYLEWNQRDRTIHSPDFVIIVTPSDSITGYGLSGTDDLESYNLSEVTGEFDLESTRQ